MSKLFYGVGWQLTKGTKLNKGHPIRGKNLPWIPLLKIDTSLATAAATSTVLTKKPSRVGILLAMARVPKTKRRGRRISETQPRAVSKKQKQKRYYHGSGVDGSALGGLHISAWAWRLARSRTIQRPFFEFEPGSPLVCMPVQLIWSPVLEIIRQHGPLIPYKHSLQETDWNMYNKLRYF